MISSDGFNKYLDQEVSKGNMTPETKKELSEAQHKLGWKTEKAEEIMREFKENCRIK